MRTQRTSGQSAMRVLVVENDAAVRECVCELLSDADMEVCGVDHPSAACRRLAAGRDDVVLSDLRFPGSADGFDVAAEAAKRGIPCVIMSGAAHLAAEVEARGIPFLAKPFRLAELLEAVHAHARYRLAA